VPIGCAGSSITYYGFKTTTKVRGGPEFCVGEMARYGQCSMRKRPHSLSTSLFCSARSLDRDALPPHPNRASHEIQNLAYTPRLAVPPATAPIAHISSTPAYRSVSPLPSRRPSSLTPALTRHPRLPTSCIRRAIAHNPPHHHHVGKRFPKRAAEARGRRPERAPQYQGHGQQQ
jgi:hypothetical protein